MFIKLRYSVNLHVNLLVYVTLQYQILILIQHTSPSSCSNKHKPHNFKAYHTYITRHLRRNSNETPPAKNDLTHCGRVRHICVSKLSIIGSGNGLSPEFQRQFINVYFSATFPQQLTCRPVTTSVASTKWCPFACQWASYHVREIAGCACAGNARRF